MTKDIEDNLMKDVEKSKKKKKTEAKKAPKPEISKNEKKFGIIYFFISNSLLTFNLFIFRTKFIE